MPHGRNIERKTRGTCALDELVGFFGLFFVSLLSRVMGSSDLERKTGGSLKLDRMISAFGLH